MLEMLEHFTIGCVVKKAVKFVAHPQYE